MNKDYEDLMRWVMNDIRDLPNDIKRIAKKQFDNYLVMAIMGLDVKCVVNDNDDFIRFRNDLFTRI